jgi:hypothetical protein
MRPCGQRMQLVPALSRHVISCPWILRLQYTNTTRYCFILTVKCVASICYIRFFPGVGWGLKVIAGVRTWWESDRQTDETMKMKLTMLLKTNGIKVLTSCVKDRKSKCYKSNQAPLFCNMQIAKVCRRKK